MPANVEDDLARLVAAVAASSSYKTVCAELVLNIGRSELQKRRNLKDAIKATKNKLHQVAGAYLAGDMRFGRWLAELDTATRSGDVVLRDACRRIMAMHASTRERLPILDTFYATTLAACAPVHSVLDLACGFNPLAIPWMPLVPGASYVACDVFTDMMVFIGQCLPLLHVGGQSVCCDILTSIPGQPVDVALLLKALPCLEQMDKAAGLRLLDTVNARYMLVSFPVTSLGGRDKGMSENYEARLREMIAQRDWSVQRFAFATELAFLITKQAAH
jgi:16S rRNA (guanine(1405)-N(7))-methyltransferase